MLWENLTVEEFKESLKITKGVAIIPIGCLEKHGYHMPLGTDMFIAKKYKDTPYHLVELVVDIDENGNILTQEERTELK